MVGQILGPFIVSKEIKAEIMLNLKDITFHLACGYHGSGSPQASPRVHDEPPHRNTQEGRHRSPVGEAQRDDPMKTALVIIAMGKSTGSTTALIDLAKKFLSPTTCSCSPTESL